MNADTTTPAPAPAKPIVKGSVVKYSDGYYRVSARYSKTVNLSGVFTSHVHHKSVPVDQVVEAHDEARMAALSPHDRALVEREMRQGIY